MANCIRCRAEIPKADLVLKTRRLSVNNETTVVLVLCDECFDLMQHDSLKSLLELHDKAGANEIEVFSGNSKRKES